MVKTFMDNLIGLKITLGYVCEGIPERLSGGWKTLMCVEYHAIDWGPRLNKKEQRGARCTLLHRWCACCVAWGPAFMPSTDVKKRLLCNPSSGGRGRQIPGLTGQSSWISKLQVIGKGQSTRQIEHPVEEGAHTCFAQECRCLLSNQTHSPAETTANYTAWKTCPLHVDNNSKPWNCRLQCSLSDQKREAS